MNDTKPIWMSRTAWAAAVALVAGILDAFGLAHVGEAEQAMYVDGILKVAELAGAAGAIYFRHNATAVTKTPAV